MRLPSCLVLLLFMLREIPLLLGFLVLPALLRLLSAMLPLPSILVRALVHLLVVSLIHLPGSCAASDVLQQLATQQIAIAF